MNNSITYHIQGIILGIYVWYILVFLRMMFLKFPLLPQTGVKAFHLSSLKIYLYEAHL